MQRANHKSCQLHRPLAIIRNSSRRFYLLCNLFLQIAENVNPGPPSIPETSWLCQCHSSSMHHLGISKMLRIANLMLTPLMLPTSLGGDRASQPVTRQGYLPPISPAVRCNWHYTDDGTFLGGEYIYVQGTSGSQIVVAEGLAEVGRVCAIANSANFAAILMSVTKSQPEHLYPTPSPGH